MCIRDSQYKLSQTGGILHRDRQAGYAAELGLNQVLKLIGNLLGRGVEGVDHGLNVNALPANLNMQIHSRG